MTLFFFWKIILAHMIADFTLQTNAVYALKIKGVPGQLFHGGIIFLVAAIFSIPYLGYPVIWWYLLAITFMHITQDFLKTKYLKDSLLPFWIFTLDQLTHVLSIAAIFIFPLPQMKPALPESSLIFKLYTNTALTYLLIGYLVCTWEGTYLIDAFIKTFLKNKPLYKNASSKYFIPLPEKYYGMAERALLATLCFFGGPFYLMTLPTMAIRFCFKNLRSWPITILGLILSAATGVILRTATGN